MRIFENCKMWSIYTDAANLATYIDGILDMFPDEDATERCDTSKPFWLTDPLTGKRVTMYCITLICTTEEIKILSEKFNLLNC